MMNETARKIPMGIILAMILQSITIIWWTAKLDSRVAAQEAWAQKNQSVSENVFRLEERIVFLHESLNELEQRVDNGS